MGCDIHFVVEAKVETGEWIGVYVEHMTPDMAFSANENFLTDKNGHTYPIGLRNYNFFAALAGVRGDGPPAKGIPTDVSATARVMIERDGEDGHSHSWCSMEEFITKWLETTCFENVAAIRLSGKKLAIHEVIGVWDDELADMRVVFWFDN